MSILYKESYKFPNIMKKVPVKISNQLKEIERNEKTSYLSNVIITDLLYIKM